MKKFYQTEWFDIEFKSFIKTNSSKLAENEFYDRFYEEFYKKYASFEELPINWRNTKQSVADLILQHASDNDKLLSIGCGNGYIEYLLKKEGRDIIAIEPSIKSTHFLKKFSDIKLYNGYFPECLNDQDIASFDLIYMSGTEYVFNDKELIELLDKIKDFKPKQFLMISASIDNSSLISSLKYLAKKTLGSAGLMDLGQFWGYKRSPSEFLKIFQNSGFENIEIDFLGTNQLWIKGT